jgi:hypothetical protein
LSNRVSFSTQSSNQDQGVRQEVNGRHGNSYLQQDPSSSSRGYTTQDLAQDAYPYHAPKTKTSRKLLPSFGSKG